MKIKTYRHKEGCLTCGVRLSRYNPDPSCALHSGKATRSDIHRLMYLSTENKNYYQPEHSPRPVYRIAF